MFNNSKFLSFFLLFLFVPVVAFAAQSEGNQPIDPDVYIIVYKQGVHVRDVTDALVREHGVTRRYLYEHALKGSAVHVPPGRLKALQKDPRIDYVEKNRIVNLHAQTLPTGVDRINGELQSTAKIDGIDERMDVDIAIIDTGIDLDHPDLNVFQYVNCSQYYPYTCTEGDAGANDTNGHGTIVAGIAAAIDNNTGVVGVAPGARLWAIRVMGTNGTISSVQVLAAIDYVTANAGQIEVANMSLGFVGTSSSLDTALSNSAAAGVVYTVSAGNEMLDVSQTSPGGHPDVITVSALADFDGMPGGLNNMTITFTNPSCTENVDDSFACLSNFGAGVDIMAPGIKIISTYNNGGLATASGTSMSSPHAAGAAALYLIENPGSTPAQVKAALIDSGHHGPCSNSADGTCSDDPDGIQEPLLFFPEFATGDIAPHGTPDGVVDVADAMLALRIASGQVSPTPLDLARGDVFPRGAPNGTIDLPDALLIFQKAAGLTSF